ncbi:MAG: S9 family peptidase [Ignavibacteria bacterium]|nr:S9 family peptidase [Ignavibacteria bacterium]
MKFFLNLALLSIMTLKFSAIQPFNPPASPKIPVTDLMHGFVFEDDYRWLEDKDDVDVKKWSVAQDDYTKKYVFENYPELKGYREEVTQYLNRDIRNEPFFKGYREFFYQKRKGEQQYKLWTIIKGKEIQIFDPEALDPSGKTAIQWAKFTRDGNKAAVGTQYQGSEISECRIIDTKTGKEIHKPIKNVYRFTWTKDEKHCYITFRDREMIEKQTPLSLYLHKIDDDFKNDILLYTPEDSKISASAWDDEYGDYTFMSISAFYTNTLYIKKTGTKDEFKKIYSSDKYYASPTIRNDKIYIYTNHEASNYKIMVTDISKPEFEYWKDFIPEQETFLEGFAISTDYFIIQDTKDVESRLRVYDYNGKFIKDLELPDIANVGGMSYYKEANKIFVSLRTINSPAKTYKIDGKKLDWEFYFQDKVPIDTKDIVAKKVFYNSKDGTKVPLFIMHRKDLELNGKNPTLLYGYGGFNVSMYPGFVGLRASLINRGWIYAVACIRGGNEYGEDWHRGAMFEKKQNSFDDFIAAAEYLIDENYTSPSHLAIEGGSNGGLLVGAVMTQRPELFKAVVCAVPLLDMLRYHKFLIARFWISEYGDPDKAEDFTYIKDYSPYHNIKLGFNYPATLIKTGENDSRVDPLHAKKFAAALQNLGSQKNPIMLAIDFESGHGSGKSIEQMVNDYDLNIRFLNYHLLVDQKE